MRSPVDWVGNGAEVVVTGLDGTRYILDVQVYRTQAAAKAVFPRDVDRYEEDARQALASFL
jgi:hypothetical protein